MAATQNTKTVAPAAEQGKTEAPKTEAPTTEAPKPAQSMEARKAALLAAAKERGAKAKEAPKARTKKHGYGVFETPEGHLITVNIDKTGKETGGWTLTAPDLSWSAGFKTKRDAIAWIDNTGDLAAQAKVIAAAREAAKA